jgi:hypothetical protein
MNAFARGRRSAKLRSIARRLLIPLCLLGALASAPPPPRPLPTENPLTSFSAVGSLSARAANLKKVAMVQAEIRFAHRNALTRIDLLDLSLTANNGSGNTVVIPVPAGTISAVFDLANRVVVVWSSRRPLYYRTKFTFSRFGGASAINRLSALTKYDVLSFSFYLVDHELIDGHEASFFTFDAKTQHHGGKVQQLTGHVALADDLAGLPIHADLTLGSGTPSTVTLRMDLSSISTGAPLMSQFAAPKGYKRTAKLAEVLAAMAPAQPSRPSPAPSPTATP